MKLSIKDKAKAKYHTVKQSVADKIGAFEKRVAKVDGDISARAEKRGEQLAGKLERVAGRVRKLLAK